MRSEMTINMQNYEEYFVRLLDNELSAAEVNEVNLFLQKHGELKTELEAFKATILQPDNKIHFPGKHLLHKGITTSNCDEYFLRSVENDLSPEEISEVNHFLSAHPELNKHMDAFRSTILVADHDLVFPDKELLKKRHGRVVPLYARYVLTVAVAAALFFIFFIKGIDWNRDIHNPTLAENEKTADQRKGDEHASDLTADSNTARSTHLKTNEKISSEKNPLAASKTSVIKKKKSAKKENNTEPSILFASEMEPLQAAAVKEISYRQHRIRAPYLVPVYENEKATPAISNNSISPSSGAGWLSLASVVGSELLKLSGRGDLVKEAGADSSEHKQNDALAISFQSENFSFYHKFFKKKNSSTTK